MPHNNFRILLGFLFLLIQSNLFAQSQPIDLNKAIEIALKTHPLLKSSQLSIQAAEKQIDIINNDYLPQFTAGLNPSRWKSIPPSKAKLLDNSLNDLYAELRFNQLIYNGNKVPLQSDLAKISTSHEKVNKIRLEQTIILNVSKAYFDVLKAEKVKVIYEQTLQQLKEHLKTAQSLYNIGKVSNLDVLKVEVQIAVIEDEITKAKNDLNIQTYVLNAAMGRSPETEVEVEDITDEIWSSEKDKKFDEKELLTEMFSIHPDLEKIKLDLDYKSKELALYKADYLPAVYAWGTMNWEDRGVPIGNNNWNVGVLLSYNIPFFQGGKFKDKIQQTEIKKESILSAEEALKQKLELSLKSILSKLENIKSRINSSKKVVELAEESLKSAELQYGIGKGSSLDVIDSQTISTNAMITYSQNLMDYLSMRAELNYAVGRNGAAFSK